MVRKWSYINNNQRNSTKNEQVNLIPRFIFKIFRKNTRFKNSNQGHTLFIRKLVVLRQRRLGWKPYMSASSLWTRHNLKFKNLINFYQTQALHKYTVNYSHLNMVSKTQQSPLIGLGQLPLNYTFTKNLPNFFSKINTVNCLNLNNAQTFSKSNTKLIPQAQFNKLSSSHKLNTLGFNFTSTVFSKTQLPFLKTIPTTGLKQSLENLPINILTTFKTLHVHLTLLYIK